MIFDGNRKKSINFAAGTKRMENKEIR